MLGHHDVKKVLYGGDYNPEQWPQEVWQEDMRLLRMAGIDVVTLNVFSWAALQPSEDTYDFSQLDRIMELVRENGLKVCLATSTAAHPAWMAARHPDILRTEFNGMKRRFGGRHNSCPNSPTYRTYSARLARELARRYGGYDNVVAWHISNEYGGECYCENCAAAFRVWLQRKYGTLEELNHAWCTAFWSHTFYSWDEIVPPNLLSEHFEMRGTYHTMFQGISLDYARFNSDSMLECFELERREINTVTPHIPVTTNLMGFYKPLDYRRWAEHMDFISWDSYPSAEESPAVIAMRHDLMRGLKGGMPFALMEQTPSVSNWQPYCTLKRPGVMRLLSLQAMAHGADTVMFFQMRRSIGACEKYHSAVIEHAGHEHTRVFREVAALGNELKTLGAATLGGRTDARVALLFDWENWWAVEYSAGPSDGINYQTECLRFYEALHGMNIGVDIIGAQQDLDRYDIVIAPMLYMIKPGVAERLKAYVSGGKTLVCTYLCGYTDENDRVITGGYPGPLRELLGIWVEETDALPPDCQNTLQRQDGTQYPAYLLCDLLHSEGAEVLARYTEDFYAGMPALTRNRCGGDAYYIATASSPEFYRDFLAGLCHEKQITPPMTVPAGVEVTRRVSENGSCLYLLNHTAQKQEIPLNEEFTNLLCGRRYAAGDTLHLEPKDAAILHGSAPTNV